jgi:hypothetical protein
MARRLAYNLRSILKDVPAGSGVYALHSQTGCVYVGEGEDICANLLEHLHDDNPCLDLQTIYLTFFASCRSLMRPARPSWPWLSTVSQEGRDPECQDVAGLRTKAARRMVRREAACPHACVSLCAG